jgi:hypothetical protein
MVFNLINRVFNQWIPGVYTQGNLPKQIWVARLNVTVLNGPAKIRV